MLSYRHVMMPSTIFRGSDMKVLPSLLVLIVVTFVAIRAWRYKTLRPLLPWKYNFGKRRNTLRATLSLLDERGARTLVETGVARHGLQGTKGDGASTIVFGVWAKQHDAHLHSVDVSPEAVSRARQAIDELGLADNTSIHTSDSVRFLATFGDEVDFLYLDSYDYDKKNEETQKLSQQHHLEEFQAIEGKLHQDSVVLIDDCNLPGGGKGKLVIDYMVSKGWNVYRYEYQAILLQQAGG